MCDLCGKRPVIGSVCLSTRPDGCVRDVWKVSKFWRLVLINEVACANQRSHPESAEAHPSHPLCAHKMLTVCTQDAHSVSTGRKQCECTECAHSTRAM